MVECLVALVLLTSAVLGATAALFHAIRLAELSQGSAVAARSILRQIDDFESGPCPTRDSAWVEVFPDRSKYRWTVAVDSAGVSLLGMGMAESPHRESTLAVRLHRRCLA